MKYIYSTLSNLLFNLLSNIFIFTVKNDFHEIIQQYIVIRSNINTYNNKKY